MTDQPSDRPTAPARPTAELDGSDYRRLSEFRFLIRCFLEFSEMAALRTGLTTRQHQALLAIKGIREGAIPTIGYLAQRLRVQHHSAVELVDRLVEAGLIVRAHDPQDRRRVILELTSSAERHLAELSPSHLIELQRMRPALLDLLEQSAEVRSRDEQCPDCLEPSVSGGPSSVGSRRGSQ